MPTIKKIYHRGNDDKNEGNYLTAIFIISLSADTSTCCVIQTAGGAFCTGIISFKMDITIKSPAGEGNGNATAATWVTNYGVESFGTFSLFNSLKAKDAPAEEWIVSQSIALPAIPCMLQAHYKNTMIIRIQPDKKGRLKNYEGPAYLIEYSISVKPCGVVTMDFELKQGEKAFALDGGKPDLEVRKRALKEVKKGDKPPFGLKKEFPAPDDREVSESGEIVKKEAPKNSNKVPKKNNK